MSKQQRSVRALRRVLRGLIAEEVKPVSGMVANLGANGLVNTLLRIFDIVAASNRHARILDCVDGGRSLGL